MESNLRFTKSCRTT